MLSMAMGKEEEEGQEDDQAHCEELLKVRFEQYVEWLDRAPSMRECSHCRKPGADCVLLPMGDYDTIGLEWTDPVCPHMACRTCLADHMMRSDVQHLVPSQRCPDCLMPYGGFHVHDVNTKKLMLLQAAKEILLHWPERKPGEPPLSFDAVCFRNNCIKAVIDHGLLRALHVTTPHNKASEGFCFVAEGCTASAWSCFMDATGTSGNGYMPAELDGRVYLALAEAEAQLDSYEQAAAYATRAGELFSALPTLSKRSNDISRITDAISIRAHPARRLSIPAMHIARVMKEKALAEKQAKKGTSKDMVDDSKKKKKKKKRKK